MIRIKVEEIHRHRNETTFRPFFTCRDYFRSVGIDIGYIGNSYDYAWVGNASYSDKNVSLSESIDKGLEFLNKITGDYWLFDGQDSASMIGTYDVFLQSKAEYLLKNTMYVDKNDYTLPFTHGRSYWGMSLNSWKIRDFSKFHKVLLSGTNWLSTVTPNWFSYRDAKKEIDVFALFSYPGKENYEFEIQTNTYYDEHRMRCIEYLKMLPRRINVKMLESGNKIPIQEYYELMSKSKIVIAPFGYGEIAPRDIESAMVGAILFKPEMNHIQTIPNIFVSNETYVPLKWNFDDMNQKIIEILSEWPNNQNYFVENMRNHFSEKYDSKKLVEYIYNLIRNEPGVTIEN